MQPAPLRILARRLNDLPRLVFTLVLATLHGHAHQPFIYQWNGIDVYHPPHFRQKDPKNGGPVSHGIFVFRVAGEELTVAERRLDGTWGMSSRKTFPLSAP